MPMQCNLDSRGKAVRLIWGILCLIAAILLALLWALPAGSAIAWTITALLAGLGIFGIFEARSGWCIVRAMGFKTPM